MSRAFRALESREANSDVDGGLLCLAFANTVHDHGRTPLEDDVDSYAALLDWSHGRGIIDAGTRRNLSAVAKRDPRAADAALSRARKLRAALYRVLSARSRGLELPAADLESVNAVIRSAMSGSELSAAGSGITWRWRAGEGLVDSILWPIARSAAHVLTSGDADRIVECTGKTCTWLILDTSKNHSRKYCSAQGCGNRTRVRRHYERQRASGS